MGLQPVFTHLSSHVRSTLADIPKNVSAVMLIGPALLAASWTASEAAVELSLTSAQLRNFDNETA